MKLKKASLLVAGVWLLVTGNLAHASYLCTVSCVYAGSVVSANEVDAIVPGNPLTDVLGDPGDPPNTGLGVVLANRNGGTFDTPTTDSTLTVQMTEGILGDGMLWVIGDEETPAIENEVFKVFVSATGDFDTSGEFWDLGTSYNNAFINLSGFPLLPTTLNYVKLQAFTNPLGGDPPPAPMAVLGIAGQSPVPVPAAFWLFGSGLLGLIAAGKRRHG